jgi:hypothetical protein
VKQSRCEAKKEKENCNLSDAGCEIRSLEVIVCYERHRHEVINGEKESFGEKQENRI